MNNAFFNKILIPVLLIFYAHLSFCQKTSPANLVYVDKEGVLRYTKTKKEAAFFGVNYTVPFAYGYRSHKALGVDLEKAIDADVAHMARLGLDAFRVHMWDVEISDSLGNILNNEHLRLFDYLLAQLKKYNIKILITPIAFWGNGYPEQDEKTSGFSTVYGKGNAVILEPAIKAQEVYLQQVLKHINPYTKLSYKDDPDIIAVEINNEPHHSGPKEQTTKYINRLAAAVKKTGWSKPIFYNISESPTYADAVAAANVDGHSFQWYPTGLVAGHALKGNYLPNVDLYKIPFGDTIPGFTKRAKMVYEFESGDVLQSFMYPAMARSFRTAGFQWATQFAYDPMATAYANTEYQTHYLNLIYTPSKAISLLIASKVFHQLPRLKNYGIFPTDTLFGTFRVSYRNELSEMNSDEEFYYTNSTATAPKNAALLKHIAGVGSSPVVQYTGSGAYFLDKIKEGVWQLEVMPDAISIKDPFEKASPKKEVTRVQWQRQKMKIILPGISENFIVAGINEGNTYNSIASGNEITIEPGIYYVTNKAVENNVYQPLVFYAPKPFSNEPVINHTPAGEITAGFSAKITAIIAGVDSADKVMMEIRSSANRWKTITLQQKQAAEFIAEIPADLVTPGLLNYRIILQKRNGDYYTFPGGTKGNPYTWDYYNQETYQTFVAAKNTWLELFQPQRDRAFLNIYNPDWRNNAINYTAAEKPGQLVWQALMNKPAAKEMMGWQLFVGDKLTGRSSELDSFGKLVVRARSSAKGTILRIALINDNAVSFATTVPLSDEFGDITISLGRLSKDSMLLLPRPYPGFLPLWFSSAAADSFLLKNTDKLEITFESNATENSKPFVVELESVWLKK